MTKPSVYVVSVSTVIANIIIEMYEMEIQSKIHSTTDVYISKSVFLFLLKAFQYQSNWII